jgi:nucleoside-diphosphate-sugar epimerase
MLENDGRVVSNMIVQALSGKPLTVYGTGSQTRSFCYVSDMVSALVGPVRRPLSLLCADAGCRRPRR